MRTLYANQECHKCPGWLSRLYGALKSNIHPRGSSSFPYMRPGSLTPSIIFTGGLHPGTSVLPTQTIFRKGASLCSISICRKAREDRKGSALNISVNPSTQSSGWGARPSPFQHSLPILAHIVVALAHALDHRHQSSTRWCMHYILSALVIHNPGQAPYIYDQIFIPIISFTSLAQFREIVGSLYHSKEPTDFSTIPLSDQQGQGHL